MTFDDAVAKYKEYAVNKLDEGFVSFYAIENPKADEGLDLIAGNKETLATEMLNYDPGRLATISLHSAENFDWMKQALSIRLRNNEPLEPILKIWLADLLDGKIKRPRARKKANSTHHVLSRMIIDELINEGVQLSRRSSTDQTQEIYSAFDVVSKIFGTLKLKPNSAEGVKNSYYFHKRGQAENSS